MVTLSHSSRQPRAPRCRVTRTGADTTRGARPMRRTSGTAAGPGGRVVPGARRPGGRDHRQLPEGRGPRLRRASRLLHRSRPGHRRHLQPRCSGSLLADHVTIVTAGHCTAGVDEGRDRLPAAGRAELLPRRLRRAGRRRDDWLPYTGRRHVPPRGQLRLRRVRELPNTGDVGVVVLDAPYTTVSGTYGALPQAGAVTTYAASTTHEAGPALHLERLRAERQKPVPVSFRSG